MGMRRTLTSDFIKQCLLRVGWAGNRHYDLEIWGQIWISRVLWKQGRLGNVAVCAPHIIPPGGISCQQKSFRSAIYFSVLISNTISRTTFVSKNHFQTHAAGVSIKYFRFQGSKEAHRILVLIFPQVSTPFSFLPISWSQVLQDQGLYTTTCIVRMQPIFFGQDLTKALGWITILKKPIF